jgi:SAM-dependent methyltransferase
LNPNRSTRAPPAMQPSTLDSGRLLLRGMRERIEAGLERRRRECVERVLTADGPPRPYAAAEDFERLQAASPARADYGYDPHTSWWRGVQRAHWVMPALGIERPGARVLEVACGDGMTGRALAEFGHQVQLSDIEDWRDARARALPFEQRDVAQGFDFAPDSFDAVLCFNAFIHFMQPREVLAQLETVLRPGGRIYLEFGFLYPSPWGLHAYRSVRIPYAQYLLEEGLLRAQLRRLGLDAWPAALGRSEEGVIPLNGWSLARYDQLFARSGCKVLSRTTRTDTTHLAWVEQNAACFAGRGLTYDDLVTTSMTVVLEKPAAVEYP